MATILVIYGFMSVVAFGLYGLDKRRAVRGEWRISERTLHGAELLGGWPGGWLGQRVFHHKGKKTQYLVVFWTIGLIHALAWAWWFGAFG